MSDVTTRRKKRIVARLAALAIVAAFASSAMLAWVAFLPGSCSFAATTRVSSESSSAFLRRAGRIVPETLITKYRDTRSGRFTFACVTHVWPSAAWSALAPFQLLAFSSAFKFKQKNAGRASLSLRRAHRVAGRALVATSATMTFGYVFAIHKKGLHFHKHDFPSLESNEAFSAAPALAALWRVVGGADAFEAFEHACACWFFATAAFAAFVAARGNRTGDRRRWVRRHRAWAIRHLAAGYSVAAQRALVALIHVSCRSFFAECACASPAAQKGIFADALVLGTALCVAAGEAAIRDADALDEPEGKEE